MEKLFERHDEYLNIVPMDFIRNFMYTINWDSRLICIKGPKGVGKSTLLLQKIKKDNTFSSMKSTNTTDGARN